VRRLPFEGRVRNKGMLCKEIASEYSNIRVFETALDPGYTIDKLMQTQ